MNPDDKNPLMSARKKLYAKKNEIGDLKRIRLKRKKYEVNQDWTDEEPVQKKPEEPKVKKPMTFYTKFLIFSVSFFTISLLSAFFIFNSGANQITYEKVSVGVQGPNYISGGETVSFIVSINNQNSVPIVSSDVYVLYPQGTVEPGSPTISMLRDRESFEKILPGETKEVRFSAIMFGSEGETKKIQVRYEYRVENSNAIFHKDKDYDIRISTAPVNVTSSHTSSVISGEEIEIEVEIASNSTEDVSNLALKVDYPFGFVFESATPEPISGNDLWDVGTVLAAESKKITIKGVIGGQDEEERVFRYSVGSKDEESITEIGSIFSASESVVSIKRPDFGLDMLVNGESGTIRVDQDDRVSVRIEATNNLTSRIINPNIEVELKGNIFDPRTVEVEDGFFNSRTNKIVWSKQTSPDFDSLENGQTVPLFFSFKIRSDIAGTVKDPSMIMELSAVGETFSDTGNERGVYANSQSKVEVNSDMIAVGRTYYDFGPIENSGPIPPKVGEVTEYTINWEAISSTNDFSDTVIKAVLPAYVEYLGVYTPSNERISYDQNKKEVVWNVGKLAAFSGYEGQAKREVYFQVSVEPSISQVGAEINLLNSKTVTAIDSFTGKVISQTFSPDTTRLINSNSENGDGAVVE